MISKMPSRIGKKIDTAGKLIKSSLRKLPGTARSNLEYCFMMSVKESVNNVEMRVVGLSRSGNHPIINWIGRQFPGEKVCLLNSAQPKTNPFVTGFSAGYDERKGFTICFNDFMINKKWEQKGRFKKKYCLIYSYEDVPLDEVAAPEFEANREMWIGASLRRYDILILRDPFNLFASRFAAKFMEPPEIYFKLVGLWKNYAKEFLRITSYLNNRVVAINYNDWFSSVGYREELANKLDLPFSDKGVKKVVSMGFGSSFDGQTFSGRAQEMEVLKRWKNFADDPFYRTILNDPELIELSNRIFGHISGTEVLFE